VSFTYRCAAAHERIKDHGLAWLVRDVKVRREIFVLVKEATEDCAAKDGTKPVGPPFVDVVNRAVYFLAPALSIPEHGQKLDWKVICLNEFSCHLTHLV
jgi:hypothetical protein